MQIIDGFTHLLPRTVYDKLVEVHPTEELLGFDEGTFLWDLDKRFTDMDDLGIDKQVTMLALPSLWRGIDHDVAPEAVRFANDEVSRIASEHADRLIPVGTLPLLGEEYEDEFDRCIDDLGMAGIQIFANVDGQPIDSPEFRWIFDRAEAEGVALWLHPQLTDWYEWDGLYLLNKILGWPFDTSMAMSRLVFSGVMDDYPDLQFVVHHMGAMIPHFVDRLQTFYQHTVEHLGQYPDRGFSELSEPLRDAYRRFNVDTAVSGSAATFHCSYDYYGVDNVVFGTDYPFGPEMGRLWVKQIPDLIDNAEDISDEDRERLYHGNIESLIS